MSVAGRVVADGGADQRSRDRGGVVAATATDLMTDYAADDRSEESPGPPFLATVIDRVVTSLFPAFPDRRRYGDVANDRLGGYHLGIIVLCGTAAMRRIRPSGRAKQHRREGQGSDTCGCIHDLVLVPITTGHLPAWGQD